MLCVIAYFVTRLVDGATSSESFKCFLELYNLVVTYGSLKFDAVPSRGK